MFKNYISYTEFLEYFPQSTKIETTNNIAVALNNASVIVSNDLRKMDIDVSRVYVPKMFDGDVRNAQITKTDYESAGIALGNEKRLVVDVSNVTSATFYLDGSNDNTNWNRFEEIDGTQFTLPVTDIGLHSKLFVDAYSYIRYGISGEATYSIYIVDTAFDLLIMYKTLELISMGKLGYDGAAEVLYEQSKSIYNSMINNIRFDYDVNNDGSVDTLDKNVVKHYTIAR